MNTQLKTALANRERLERIKEHLLQLDTQLQRAKLALEQANQSLHLKSSKVKSFFVTLSRGFVKEEVINEEEQLEKRHQLLLKRRELEEEVKMLSFEKSVLEEQLEEWPAVQQTLENIKHLREQQLKDSDSWLGVSIRTNNQLQADLQEWKQAIQTVVIKGSQLGKALLKTANDVKRLSQHHPSGGSAWITKNQQVYTYYDFLDKVRGKLRSLGEMFPKFDEAISGLQQVYRYELPSDQMRFFKYDTSYFANLLYKGELQNNMEAAYLILVDLWRSLQRTNKGFKLKINQVDHQLNYLNEKKDRLLEEV